jgi:hypothetical protein
MVSDIALGLAFFYCDYKKTATHHLSNILGCLIKQLVLQDLSRTALTGLTTFYDRFHQSNPHHLSPEKLPHLLREVSRSFSAVNIIIDGLDEISFDRSDTVEKLEQIDIASSHTKTLFASRREFDIEQALERYKKISIAAQSSDLELYVASEIESRTTKRQLNIKDPDLKEQIMKRLINGSDGMYVLHLMFTHLAISLSNSFPGLGGSLARSTIFANFPRTKHAE